MDDLHAILRQTKTTAVIATHDRLEALRLSDTMAVMFQGRIAQIGSPEVVMNRPADEQVASFVGTETILSGTVAKIYDGTFMVSVAGRQIEAVGVVSEGEQVVCCIRPEQVTISTDASAGHSSARNTFKGTIVKISPMGLFYKVQLDCGFPLVSFVTTPSLENLELKEGKHSHCLCQGNSYPCHKKIDSLHLKLPVFDQYAFYYIHFFRLNNISITLPIDIIKPSINGYPQCHSSSGIYLKFIP